MVAVKVLRSGLGLLSLIAVASCGEDDGPPSLDQYFTASPYATAACNAVDGALTGQREMRLFQGGNVDVLGLTQGLARYYKRHSLTFFASAQPHPAGTTYALDTDEPSLRAALIAAFPGIQNQTDAQIMADPARWNQIQAFVTNFVLRPMTTFARVHGDVGPDATNLVVLPELERPGGEKASEPGTALLGLAISPELLAELSRSSPEEAAIWFGVDLPANFTPMMFLGHRIITRFALSEPVLRDLVVSHEFGHTAGLPHSSIATNLMFRSDAPGHDSCLNPLTPAQLESMRTNLGLVSATTGALTSGPPPPRLRAAAPAAKRALFGPADLRALLGGDPGASRRLLQPLLETMTVRVPATF
jgi:hypothetical protein